MILLVLVVGLLSLAYYYYVQIIKKYASLFKIPGPRGNFFLGNALDFKSSEGKYYFVGINYLILISNRELYGIIALYWNEISVKYVITDKFYFCSIR